MDLQIGEGSGPFWIISIAAEKNRNYAISRAKKLRKNGWPAHIAWLGNYGSAKYKNLWVIYIGPYAMSERNKVEQLLPKVKAQINPKAYAVTLGATGQRQAIK